MYRNKLYRSRVFVSDISTDDIIPAKYKHMYVDPSKMAIHIFSNIYKDFYYTINVDDIIVCKSTFGIGSSREQAVSSLLAAGIKIIISKNFGRIFFRNSWNLGLILIEADTSLFEDGMFINIDLDKGLINFNNNIVKFNPPSKFMMDIVNNGGIINSILKRK